MDEHLMSRATIGYVLDAEHMIQYARHKLPRSTYFAVLDTGITYWQHMCRQENTP